MNFQDAINYLSTPTPRQDAIDCLVKAVSPLCKVDPRGEGCTLREYLNECEYDGNETPESIADQWDRWNAH